MVRSSPSGRTGRARCARAPRAGAPQAVSELDGGERHRQMARTRRLAGGCGHLRLRTRHHDAPGGRWRRRRLPRRRTGGPPAGKAGTRRRRARAVDHVEQAQARLPAELVQVHVDRGHGRPRRGGDDIPVVEADHGDVVGHAHTRLTQAVDDAACDLVAAAEDRVDRPPKAGQMPRRLVSEGFPPRAVRTWPARPRRPAAASASRKPWQRLRTACRRAP